MFRLFSRFALLIVLVAAAVSFGCRRGPARIHPPGINASAAGKQAMETYDKDGDGVVKGSELDAAPSLKAALKNLDKDGDGGVSAEEVTARVKVWKESRIGLMPLRCTVRRHGRPLPGATVTLEPEKFLGDKIQAAVGTTDNRGVAALAIPDRQPPGVACGFYLVRISQKQGDQETIPPVYNDQTTLGHEVFIDPHEFRGGIFFNLTR